jgi:hypothetical protein
VSNHIAKYLVIGYRSAAGEFFLGIVVLAPHSNELYMQWRDDLQFVDPDDFEILAHLRAHVIQLAQEKGRQWVFDWMADTLSTTIFVEGPLEVITATPQEMSAELFERYRKRPYR